MYGIDISLYRNKSTGINKFMYLRVMKYIILYITYNIPESITIMVKLFFYQFDMLEKKTK
jgi:hypothetical protein